jgi:hypothetical protein
MTQKIEKLRKCNSCKIRNSVMDGFCVECLSALVCHLGGLPRHSCHCFECNYRRNAQSARTNEILELLEKGLKSIHGGGNGRRILETLISEIKQKYGKT